MVCGPWTGPQYGMGYKNSGNSWVDDSTSIIPGTNSSAWMMLNAPPPCPPGFCNQLPDYSCRECFVTNYTILGASGTGTPANLISRNNPSCANYWNPGYFFFGVLEKNIFFFCF
jgi:hypothetical protein